MLISEKDLQNPFRDLTEPIFHRMSKWDVESDDKFMNQCFKYGADLSSFDGFGVFRPFYFYTLRTGDPKVKIMLDRNFNTIAIVDEKEYMNNEKGFNQKKYMFDIYKKWHSKNTLPYPFDKISLGQLVELSHRIEIHNANDRKFGIKVNGLEVTDKKDGYYFRLLPYIQLIGKKVEEYQESVYRTKLLGFECPDVYEYAKQLIDKINEYINMRSKRKGHINTYDLIYDFPHFTGTYYKGWSEENWNPTNIIVNLLLNDKGYKFVEDETSSYNNRMEKYDGIHIDLSLVVEKLANILRVSRSELKEYESKRIKLKTSVNLRKWIPERIKKDLEDEKRRAMKEQEERAKAMKGLKETFEKAIQRTMKPNNENDGK